MSNPTVSFRISDYHLARGLRAVRKLEPSWQLTTTANLIRTIFNDYIAKSEHLNKTPLNISPELLQEIAIARAGSSKQQAQNEQLDTLPQLGKVNQIQKPEWQIQQELEDEKIFNQIKREEQEKQAEQEKQEKQASQIQQETDIDQQIELAAQASRRVIPKASAFVDPNNTESDISSVTDFSPPTDWIS
jgi:hypothetical protein